ncbi:hypothetical protein NHX12_005418, partial [Muraenolepis orangiensis]
MFKAPRTPSPYSLPSPRASIVPRLIQHLNPDLGRVAAGPLAPQCPGETSDQENGKMEGDDGMSDGRNVPEDGASVSLHRVG